MRTDPSSEQQNSIEFGTLTEAGHDRGQELQAGRQSDQEWRAERREQVVESLEQVEGRYAGATDLLTRLASVMGIVFLMGLLTILVMAGVGGFHLAMVGLLLMVFGALAILVLLGVAGICWLARTSLRRLFHKWARWQAIDLDAHSEQKT